MMVYSVPKLPAVLLAGVSFALFIAYVAAVWLGESYAAELASGFLGFSVLLLSGYIGFAGARNMSLGPVQCFLNGAFISGIAFLLLLAGVSAAVLLMGKMLSLEASMLVSVVVMALIGGICGLLGWLAAKIIGSAKRVQE